MAKEKKIGGRDFFWLALYAFLGLGMEIVLLMAESALYGTGGWGAFTLGQSLAHWGLTCVVWGLFALVLARAAKRKYGFGLLQRGARMKPLLWVLAFALVVVSVALNALDGGGLKLVREWQGKAPVAFLFQYIYYLFEVMLVVQILAFGQRAFDMWTKKTWVPWGGIVLAFTWGLVHALTKGSLIVGLMGFGFSLLYGLIYLCVKKQPLLAYPLVLLAFAV